MSSGVNGLSKRYFYGYGGCLAELVEGKWGRKGSLGIRSLVGNECGLELG